MFINKIKVFFIKLVSILRLVKIKAGQINIKVRTAGQNKDRNRTPAKIFGKCFLLEENSSAADIKTIERDMNETLSFEINSFP